MVVCNLTGKNVSLIDASCFTSAKLKISLSIEPKKKKKKPKLATLITQGKFLRLSVVTGTTDSTPCITRFAIE